VPSQVTIAAGVTSASFPVTTRPVTAATTAQITAAWGVFTTKTATLTLLPPDIASFQVNPGLYNTSIYVGGTPITGTITLTAPAPTEGMTVYLSTIGRALGGTTGTFPQCGQFPTMPSTVTVNGGSTSATVSITTYPGYGTYMGSACQVPQNCNHPVSLTYGSLYGFRVLPPPFSSTSLVLPSSVKGGNIVQAKFQLMGPAMPVNCGNRYLLASSNTNYAQVPPYVDVTPGMSQGTFPITTSALPAGTSQTVTISVTGPALNDVGLLLQPTYSTNLTITP
jgi:hypothetical protein